MTVCKELDRMLARQLIRIRQHLANCEECTLQVQTLNGCVSLKEKEIGSLHRAISVLSKAQEPDKVGCDKGRERLDARCLHFPTIGGEGSAEVLPSPSQEPKVRESKKILCVKCNKPIHIKDFGAMAKQGLYHGDCMVDELTQEPNEDDERRAE